MTGQANDAGEQAWRAAVDTALKGSPFERLTGRLAGGIAVDPIYPADSASRSRALRSTPHPWRITQRVDHPDPAEANALALADLEGGASGLEIVVAGGSGAHGHGVRIEDTNDINRLFDGVLLDLIRLRVDAGADAPRLARLLLGHLDRTTIEPASVKIDFGLDPVGLVALGTGEADDDLPRLLTQLAGSGVGGTFLSADGRVAHAAGGSEVQEIAYVLASGLHHLRILEQAGVDPAGGASRIGLALTADEEVFPTIAKLRAARGAWGHLLAECGVAGQAHIHAETSWRTLARVEPYTNLLRGATAAAAAGLGEADSITILPLSQALGLPDPFARRMSRNIQVMLQEESGLARVQDPAAGSGYVEALTETFAEQAWETFQEIEKQGGILAALRDGGFRAQVAEVRDRRMAALRTGKATLTGVTAYPSLEQAKIKVLRPAPPVTHIVTQNTDSGAPNDTVATPLVPTRLGAPFEALREAADRRTEETGTRPSIYLAGIGKLADYGPRATWTRNLLAVAGIGANGADADMTSLDDLAAAAHASSGGEAAPLVILCGTDAAYAEHALALAEKLNGAPDNSAALWLAGRPGDLEADLTAAGVSRFIFAGCDMIETGEAAHALFKIES